MIFRTAAVNLNLLGAAVLGAAALGAPTAGGAGAARAANASTPAVEQPPVIPLCPGLTIVTAVNQQEGDYESIKTIQSVSASEVRMKYSAEIKNADMLSSGPAVKDMNLQRTMLTPDLESAVEYQQAFLENFAETIPNTTSIGTSAAVLRALKSQGSSPFAFSIAYAGLELTADSNKSPNYYSYFEQGTLKRADGAATLAVIVNDRPVELPVVRGEGDFLDDKVEFLFLDDVRNPLTLAFRIGIGAIKPLDAGWLQLCKTISKNGQPAGQLPGGARCDRPNGGDRDALRVVKIAFRCAAPAAPAPADSNGGGAAAAGAKDGPAIGPLEEELTSARKADVYSLYFTFNSDAIREESEPTLKEIADVLKRHPDWKLGINGHTDGIGADAYNLDLSKRRAAAVKAALVTRYGIDAGRLVYAGFGKTQPKDTNDTLEGRARNRRVELIRQ